jgi:hypothetical protein
MDGTAIRPKPAIALAIDKTAEEYRLVSLDQFRDHSPIGSSVLRPMQCLDSLVGWKAQHSSPSAFGPPHRNNNLGSFGPEFSPDGKWAVWPGSAAGKANWTVARVDGSKLFTVPRINPGAILSGSAVWLPGGAQWVSMEQNNGSVLLALHDLKSPKQFTTLREPTQYGGTLLGVLADGRALIHVHGQWVDSNEMKAAKFDPLIRKHPQSTRE